MNAAIRSKVLLASQKNQPLVTYTLPVVFHIITSNPSAITDLMVINALKDLNDAFAHKSPYNTDPGVLTPRYNSALPEPGLMEV